MIIHDILPSELSRKGMKPEASIEEIRSYNRWLGRVLRGSEQEANLPNSSSGPRLLNEIDIKEKSIPFYAQFSENLLSQRIEDG
mgnify:CR=1 FL=1